VETVVLLPASLRYGQRDPLALCVLSGPQHRNEQILVADYTDRDVDSLKYSSPASPSPSRPSRLLPVQELTETLTAWRREHTLENGRLDPQVKIVAASTAAGEGIERDRRPARVAHDELAHLLEKVMALEDAIKARSDLAETDTLLDALNDFVAANDAGRQKRRGRTRRGRSQPT
jgi:hypothetical protein